MAAPYLSANVARCPIPVRYTGLRRVHTAGVKSMANTDLDAVPQLGNDHHQSQQPT